MCNFDTDIGTEELAHLEMVATIVHQLTRNLSMEEIENQRFGEALRITQDKLNSKNFYAFNPGFDRCENGNGMK